MESNTFIIVWIVFSVINLWFFFIEKPQWKTIGDALWRFAIAITPIANIIIYVVRIIAVLIALKEKKYESYHWIMRGAEIGETPLTKKNHFITKIDIPLVLLLTTMVFLFEKIFTIFEDVGSFCKKILNIPIRK